MPDGRAIKRFKRLKHDCLIVITNSSQRQRETWKYEALSYFTEIFDADHFLVHELGQIDCRTIIANMSNRLPGDQTIESPPFIAALSIVDAAIKEVQTSPNNRSTVLEDYEDSSVSEKDGSDNNMKKIFIVHGRNERHKFEVSNFIRDATGFRPTILADVASEGDNLLDKLTRYVDDSNFAVVIMSGDDFGYLASESDDRKKLRARQNVVFELGFCIAKLGKKNVAVLHEEDVDIPSDFNGVVYIEPFSPGSVSGIVPEGDDDEGGGHDRGDGGGVEGDSLQGPEVLEHGIGPLGRGPQGGQQVVAGLLVRCRAGVLRGCQHADPGPLIPLVGQDRHPQPCGPVQGGQHMESGRGQVVGGAGLHRAGVHREPGVIHHHLHVAPERLPLARVPQVAARVGVALSDPVGADQGPVQADERLFGRAQPIQDLGKVRGPVGDHAQGLMQIPVGGGPAHPRVAGQCGQGGARHHPPQQEHRLGPAGGRPLPGPHVMGPAVGGQPQADGVGDGLGNVESGRIGQHAGTPW